MLLEGEEPESLAGEREEVLLLDGELEEDSVEEEGVWEERPRESEPPQCSSPSEESDESPVNGTDRIWLARYPQYAREQLFTLMLTIRKPL